VGKEKEEGKAHKRLRAALVPFGLHRLGRGRKRGKGTDQVFSLQKKERGKERAANSLITLSQEKKKLSPPRRKRGGKRGERSLFLPFNVLVFEKKGKEKKSRCTPKGREGEGISCANSHFRSPDEGKGRTPPDSRRRGDKKRPMLASRLKVEEWGSTYSSVLGGKKEKGTEQSVIISIRRAPGKKKRGDIQRKKRGAVDLVEF